MELYPQSSRPPRPARFYLSFIEYSQYITEKKIHQIFGDWRRSEESLRAARTIDTKIYATEFKIKHLIKPIPGRANRSFCWNITFMFYMRPTLPCNNIGATLVALHYQTTPSSTIKEGALLI